jgi:hypothetical protein
LKWNCRSASTNGLLSMSPTVPPSSITHTSADSSSSSRGEEQHVQCNLRCTESSPGES